MNHDKAITVWSVADGTGYHVECDCCGRSWTPPVARPDRVSEVRLVQQTDRGDPADRDV